MNGLKVDICFLVIGSMSDLPKLAVSSALQASCGDIFIGYVNADDIRNLPHSSRISFVDLASEYRNLEIGHLSKTYVKFDNYNFNSLVQLKWVLIRKMFELTKNNFIFSDVDIIWLIDPSNSIHNTFQKLSGSKILIQNFSDSLDDPKLCMGFVALRNSIETSTIILSCQRLHRNLLANGESINDDYVITKYFVDSGFPKTILQLPQKTFPVGNMLNLYGERNAFLRMTQPKPFIFHANFAIGLKNKELLLHVFMRNNRLDNVNLAKITRVKLSFYMTSQLVSFWISYLIRFCFRFLPPELKKKIKSLWGSF